MKIKDLDEIILEKRDALFLTGNLEIENSFEEISLGEILHQVKTAAKMLSLDYAEETQNQAETIYIPKEAARDSAVKRLAKKMDERLKNCSFYREKMRPRLMRVFGKVNAQNEIDGKKLLSYEGVEFADAIYYSILDRAPDPVAKENVLKNLVFSHCTKIDLIYSLWYSEEASSKSLNITGIKCRHIYEVCKRKCKQIPLLSYPFRWIFNLFLLPKRLYGFQNAISDITFLCLKQGELLNRLQVDFLSYKNDLDDLRTSYLKQQSELKDLQISFFNQKDILERLQIWIQENRSSIYEAKQELEWMGREIWQQKEQLPVMQNKIDYLLAEQLPVMQNKIDYLLTEQKSEMQKVKSEKEKQEQFTARLNQIYLDYKSDFMVDKKSHILKEFEHYDDKLNEWMDGRDPSELKAVDLGCGFGEWLEFLMKKGMKPMGVDSNDLIIKMAERENHSLSIIQKDALQFLKDQGSETLDLVSSFHMIEHFDLETLFEFFHEVNRSMKRGGLLILATPNIRNIIISTYMFHMDPTHKMPIPPELLEFYLKEWGFELLDTISTKPLEYFPYNYNTDDPMKHVAFRFNMEQEYAVLAVKK